MSTKKGHTEMENDNINNELHEIEADEISMRIATPEEIERLNLHGAEEMLEIDTEDLIELAASGEVSDEAIEELIDNAVNSENPSESIYSKSKVIHKLMPIYNKVINWSKKNLLIYLIILLILISMLYNNRRINMMESSLNISNEMFKADINSHLSYLYNKTEMNSKRIEALYRYINKGFVSRMISDKPQLNDNN